MKHLWILLVVAACGKQERAAPAESAPRDAIVAAKGPGAAAAKRFGLARTRELMRTVIDAGTDTSAPPQPPATLFETVRYDAPLGKNVAYVSPVKEGERRPAIVWIAGGFVWGIGDTAWAPADRGNDQSARAFREQGLVLMLPALRGASGNPGHNECFLGEVDDILAAAAYLATRPDVDPSRIYLGGHSTGATLALLAAASSDRFRAIFALGAVVAAEQYGPDGCLPTSASDAERRARSSYEFLGEVVTPTYAIEGSGGNAAVLPLVEEARAGAPITVIEVPGFDHFSVISPATEVIARAILADQAVEPAFRSITAAAITAGR